MITNIKRCPQCGGSKFTVQAHIVQSWVVDEYEEYIETATECIEVTHRPSDDDLWQCTNCGYKAAGKNFNFKLVKANDDKYDIDDVDELVWNGLGSNIPPHVFTIDEIKAILGSLNNREK